MVGAMPSASVQNVLIPRAIGNGESTSPRNISHGFGTSSFTVNSVIVLGVGSGETRLAVPLLLTEEL